VCACVCVYVCVYECVCVRVCVCVCDRGAVTLSLAAKVWHAGRITLKKELAKTVYIHHL